MPDDAQNLGSFGAPIGGGSALRAAMERRGMDASVLDQVSPASPIGPSPVPSPVPEGTLGPTPGLQAPPAPSDQGGGNFRSAEMETALKALQNTVRTENKIAEAIIGV